MPKNYKCLGNIRNIPPYKDWNEFVSHGETIAESIPSLQGQKHNNRLKAAKTLTERLGYQDTDVATIVGEAADPRDFDRWNVTDYDVINKIGSLIGLAKPSGRVQTLAPGSMQPLHVDDLRPGYISPTETTIRKIDFTQQELDAFEADPRSVTRVLILLTDWRYGQGVIFGDEVCSHWKAGDVIHWDWPTNIHGTFNIGYWTRALLRLSGTVTDQFRAYDAAETPFELDYLSN